MLPTISVKVDLSHISTGELFTELKTIQDIQSSVNALPRSHYHNSIVVDYLS